jgi:hypothetical protein
MTRPPEFRELVGDDLPDEERDRLLRVHELLVQAGPPPELAPALATTPVAESRVRLLPRRRARAVLLLAAALAAVMFGAGYFVGGRHEKSSAFKTARVVKLHGTARTPSALAVVRVGPRDTDGNLPMLVTVQGLPKLPATDYYLLALTKHGKPIVTCGTFRMGGGSATTTVRFAVAYRISDFDGWTVVEYRHGRHVEPVVLTS